MDNDAPAKKGFFTKRVLFSLIILINGTVLLWFSKLSGQEFVYLCGLVILGHHAADALAAWRGFKQ